MTVWPDTRKSAVTHVEIYKDGWVPSRPWCADLHFRDGNVWKGYVAFFKTRRSVEQNIRAAVGEFVTIIRGEDK